jgi:hypothetical protein
MSGSSAGAGNVQVTMRISTWFPALFPLAAGVHTLGFQYSGSAATPTFSANYLKVQPL